MRLRRSGAHTEGDAGPGPGKPAGAEPLLAGGNQMLVRLLRSESSEQPAEGGLVGRIRSRFGRGEPLPADVRTDMESGLGHDFGDVVIHRDVEAGSLSRELGARAFTTGRDVFFGAGAYDPGSATGRAVLAHELTHTVQDNVGGTEVEPGLRVSDPHDSHEREAAAAARGLTVRRCGDHVDPGCPCADEEELTVNRQPLDGGVDAGPRDASLPGGVTTEPAGPQAAPGQTGAPPAPAAPPPVACTAPYARATSFRQLIDLVRAAEARLAAAGITSAVDQIHALRGVYYGTRWSLDYSVEHSDVRNEGFQRFTRPSQDPAATVPRDVRPLLDCNLFQALQQSQDMVEGGRQVDVGHLIIGMDARSDPRLTANVQYPVAGGLTTIDLGGSGTELVTWLGDLGGGAAALAHRRGATPATSASSVFTGSDYGGSINLEGDVAGFVVATGSPTAVTAPSLPAGRRLSDALNDYLGAGAAGPSAAWTERAKTFLKMYGGTFDPSGALTNRSALIATFTPKIQTFACNYLASRVKDGKMVYAEATRAADHVVPAASEVATAFVDALVDSARTGGPIQATRFPSPGAAVPGGACGAQIAAGRLGSIFGQ